MTFKIISFIIVVGLVFSGCAAIQQSPAIEVPPSHLASPDTPEIVDGNLETAGALQTDGFVEKRFAADFRLDKVYVNTREIVGTKRAGALIVLKKPMYISYIEIYTDSMITEPIIDVVTEKSKSDALPFVRISDRQIGKPIKAGKVQRFRIGREILCLRLMTDAIEETSSAERATVVDKYKTDVTRIPLKGPMIREVKFYEIPKEPD
jgi:hypothetical protein